MNFEESLKSIFPGNNQMAQRMRAFDWAKSELGLPHNWPEALKTCVRIILTSHHPMVLWWGDNLISLYNDGFASLLHSKHPNVLGKSASSVWPEFWQNIIKPRVEFAKHQNSGTFDEAMPFISLRRGYPELAYYTFSYSPILDDKSQFGGILCPVYEETSRIIGQRQMSLLQRLATKILDARNRKEVCELAMKALCSDSEDIPFALLYELNVNAGTATLEAITDSICTGKKATVLTIDDSIWPFQKIVENNDSVLVSELPAHLQIVQDQYPTHHAIAMPFAHGIDDRKGVLIIGLSPLRLWDEHYQEFLHLICAKVSAAIQKADAYEAEKRRVKELAALEEQGLKSSKEKLAMELDGAQKLQRISSRLIEENNIEMLCEHILDAAMDIMKSQFSSIQILDVECGMLRVLAWRNFHPESAKFWQTVSVTTGTPCAAALKRGKRIIVPDINAADFIQNSESFRHLKLCGITAVQSTPLTSRDGRVLGMISTHWSKYHKPSEYELALFDVLARQMADVLERQRALEALKESDRRKDEFLAVLAHELRNPLFPIKNAVYLLQQTGEVSSRELIQMMERQVSHMIRLVDDLLEISRITTGKIELHRETINLVNVINNAIEVSKPLLNEKQHQVIFSLSSEPLMVNADMVRMTQVFANILNNAAKYTPERGIITVTISRENNNSVISFRDNGIGISFEMLPKIFDIFIQEKCFTDLKNRGLGIGLAMVRSLVELHGGRVKAFSSGRNQGSEFVVFLPLLEQKNNIVKENKMRPLKPSFANLRVLIVDDNPDIIDSFTILLKYWNINVQAASNGPSALTCLKEFNPHAIFLDIGMPDMNGYEVAKKIRQNPQYDAIKLIALTGWNEEKDRIRSNASGFNEHLAKPIDINTLYEVFNNLTAHNATLY